MIRLAITAVMLCVGPALAHELPVIPDPELTPGQIVTSLTLEDICTTRWGRDARHVTASMKAEVFRRYNLAKDDHACHADKHGRRFEVDHLIPRELAGADAIENLWPQCYSGEWSAGMKDRLENRLRREVCAPDPFITLSQAWALLARDWRILYRHYFQ